jgi:hypothetical protein
MSPDMRLIAPVLDPISTLAVPLRGASSDRRRGQPPRTHQKRMPLRENASLFMLLAQFRT